MSAEREMELLRFLDKSNAELSATRGTLAHFAEMLGIAADEASAETIQAALYQLLDMRHRALEFGPNDLTPPPGGTEFARGQHRAARYIYTGT